MLTVSCVLKTGGDFDVRYVRILRDAVIRNTSAVRFVCFSDTDVPCERIPLKHGYPGWWSKAEIFSETRPDYFPQLYLDLDTIVLRTIDCVSTIQHDFAMLSIKDRGQHCGDSGVMWFRKPFPHVYERFAADPDRWMAEYAVSKGNKVFGDQGYISSQFEHIPKLHESLPGLFMSYKYDNLQDAVPRKPCAVVCFGGAHRPHNSPGWVKQAWV